MPVAKAVKSDFIALKAEVDNLDINELLKVPVGLDDFKTKVDNLDIGKLKTSYKIEKAKKKLSYVVSEKFVKKTVCNKLNAKVHNLETKIPDMSILIQRNQYNTDKQNLEKLMEMLKIWCLALVA